MIRTPNLDLPIYDKPDEDVFDMQEWNVANTSIDNAYKQMVDMNNEIIKANPIAELIEARYGEGTLGIKIGKLDGEIAKKANTIDVGNSFITANAEIEKKANKTDVSTSLATINTEIAKKAVKVDVDASLVTINTNLGTKVAKTDIINDVTTGGSAKVLSAEQGKVLNNNMTNYNKRISDFFGTTIIMSELKNVTDYGLALNNIMTEKKDYTIICEANKEYVFTTKLSVQGRLKVVGNDSLWRWNGTGIFIDFIESPWQIEGSVLDDLIIWAGAKTEGAYQNRTCFNIQGNHISIKFRNLKIYNFGYVWKIKDTNSIRTFGHSILECNVWGFINAVDSQGNSEQILIQHCWFDDGKRTEGSQNACIRVADATSFWIRDNIIQNCDIGVLFKGVRSGEITGNHFENMIDSSIFFLPNSVYENRNTTIMGNYLVGHKGCIRFSQAANGNKSIHTTIINNCFGFLGADATANITASSSDCQANTLMINNSKIDGARLWTSTNITTLKEFQ